MCIVVVGTNSQKLLSQYPDIIIRANEEILMISSTNVQENRLYYQKFGKPYNKKY